MVTPSTDALIADAFQVIQSEIVKFANKTRQGKSLDLAEARVLQGYLKCLVEISREGRERDKETDLSNLTNEELATLVQGLIKNAPDSGSTV